MNSKELSNKLDQDIQTISNEISTALVERDAPPNSMETGEMRLKKEKREIADIFNKLKSKVEKGMKLIMGKDQSIDTNISKKNLMVEIQEGKSMQEIYGISDETIEHFYHAAKAIYDRKDYEDAINAFSFLCFLNRKNYAFWIGLGNSEFFCNRFEEALQAYAFAVLADPFEPTPHIQSCFCYEKMGDRELAKNALDLALISMGDNVEHAEMKKNVIEYQKNLKQKG